MADAKYAITWILSVGRSDKKRVMRLGVVCGCFEIVQASSIGAHSVSVLTWADISTDEFHCQRFVERLWNLEYVDAPWGYYGNMLMAFAQLHAAGLYEIYGLEMMDGGGGQDHDGTTGAGGAAETESGETGGEDSSSSGSEPGGSTGSSGGDDGAAGDELAGMVVSLRAKHSNRCLDVPASSPDNGTVIQQWDCSGLDNQRWLIEPSAGMLRLRSIGTDKCLDISAGSTGNGALIQQWNCYNGDNQYWSFERAEEGAFQIRSVVSSKCLDVSAHSPNNGASIQQWDCANAPNQAFFLD